jgi:hypothetical protein
MLRLVRLRSWLLLRLPSLWCVVAALLVAKLSANQWSHSLGGHGAEQWARNGRGHIAVNYFSLATSASFEDGRQTLSPLAAGKHPTQ